MDDEDIFSSPNFILDILYNHPYVKAARVSHRFPDKIHIEISERTPFARVNNGPDQMIMLDKFLLHSYQANILYCEHACNKFYLF